MEYYQHFVDISRVIFDWFLNVIDVFSTHANKKKKRFYLWNAPTRDEKILISRKYLTTWIWSILIYLLRMEYLIFTFSIRKYTDWIVLTEIHGKYSSNSILFIWNSCPFVRIVVILFLYLPERTDTAHVDCRRGSYDSGGWRQSGGELQG